MSKKLEYVNCDIEWHGSYFTSPIYINNYTSPIYINIDRVYHHRINN